MARPNTANQMIAFIILTTTLSKFEINSLIFYALTSVLIRFEVNKKIQTKQSQKKEREMCLMCAKAIRRSTNRFD